MAYTGTGIETDPYIVDNYTDLCTVISTIPYARSTSYYVELDSTNATKIMDLAEVSDIVNLIYIPRRSEDCMLYLNGNGWSIRNARCSKSLFTIEVGTNPLSGNFVYVQNIHFDNILITECGESPVEKVIIGGKSYSNERANMDNIPRMTFTRCTFGLLLKNYPKCIVWANFVHCSISVRMVNPFQYNRFLTDASTEWCVFYFGAGATSSYNNIEIHNLTLNMQALQRSTTAGIKGNPYYFIKGTKLSSIFGDINLYTNNSIANLPVNGIRCTLCDTSCISTMFAISFKHIAYDPETANADIYVTLYGDVFGSAGATTPPAGSYIVGDMSGNDSCIHVDGINSITSAEAKDVNALINLGFLP